MAAISKSDLMVHGPQREWQFATHACGRPPLDLDRTILCYPVNRTWAVESSGADYDALSPCCPAYRANQNTNARPGPNLHLMANGCAWQLCFTNSETLAAGWDACVRNQTRHQLESMQQRNGSLAPGRNSTNFKWEQTGGKCELVDYDILKKGVVNKSAGARAWDHGRVGLWSIGITWMVIAGVMLQY